MPRDCGWKMTIDVEKLRKKLEGFEGTYNYGTDLECKMTDWVRLTNYVARLILIDRINNLKTIRDIPGKNLFIIDEIDKIVAELKKLSGMKK